MRRNAVLLFMVRAIADAQSEWDYEFGLVRDDRRRWVSIAGGPGGSEHGLCRIAIWRAGALRQDNGARARLAAAGGQRRAAAALELGFANHHQPACSHAALFCRQ